MQQSQNNPDTYKHLLMSRLGYLYVPPNHLQVVCRDGAFHGYLTAGYHRPRLWNMSYPQQINVSMRKYTFSLSKLRASDGGQFAADVVIKCQFDPRSIEWEAIQAKLSLAPPEAIRGIVKDALENALREAFSEYPAHTIQHGSLRTNLQRRCKHLLIAAISHLGLHIGDVMLTTITAPAAVEKRSSEAISRMIAADYLRDVPQEWLLHLLVAQMPEILENSELGLNLKGTSELTAGLKKLIQRLAAADEQAQALHQTGTQTQVMSDTIVNGNSTLH